MSYKGRKISAGFSRQRHAENSKDLDLIMRALRHGPLRTLHFDTAKRFLSSLHSFTELVIDFKLVDSAEGNPTQPASQRYLNFYFAYIAIDKNNLDHFVPMAQRFVMTQTELCIFQKAFPVQFHAAHTEFRHIQGTSHVLAYDSENFRLASAFALLLANVLDHSCRSSMFEDMPIALPHPEGLFLGEARRVDADHYWAGPSVLVRYDREPSLRGQTVIGPQWSPEIGITTRTFLPKRRFSPTERMLHTQLMPFLDDATKSRALRRFVDIYLAGTTEMPTLLSWNDRAQITALKQELTTLVHGPHWAMNAQKANARASRPRPS